MAWNKIKDMGLALAQIETICASKSSTATFQPIIAHYQALNILYHTLSGNIRDAHSSARKANRMANVMSDDLTIPVSTYIVKLRSRDEPLNKQPLPRSTYRRKVPNMQMSLRSDGSRKQVFRPYIVSYPEFHISKTRHLPKPRTILS